MVEKYLYVLFDLSETKCALICLELTKLIEVTLKPQQPDFGYKIPMRFKEMKSFFLTVFKTNMARN